MAANIRTLSRTLLIIGIRGASSSVTNNNIILCSSHRATDDKHKPNNEGEKKTSSKDLHKSYHYTTQSIPYPNLSRLCYPQTRAGHHNYYEA